MKRARRSGFSAGIFSKNDNKHQRKTERTYQEKPVDFNINDDDKKDFELKYYGKIMEDKISPENEAIDEVSPETTAEISENSSEIADEEAPQTTESQDEEVPEETVAVNEADAENEAPSNEDYDEHSDDDMKIIRKNGDEKIEVVGRQNDIESIKQDSNSAPNRSRKNDHTEKSKKLAFIFTVSLVAIILASVLAFCVGDLFGLSSLFSDNSLEITEDYMSPVDDVTGKVNVLVLGVDKEGLRTDTIIVASFDTDNNKVNLLSIPRDTRMYVGSKYQKINAAHAISQSGKIKGPQGAIEAVTRLTGIPINYYVEFSFDAFEETIDALGGVYFDVPQNMKYRDPVQDLYINLSQGYQLLDGDKAEQLVRFRQYPEGDIKRLRVQQDFIKSIADQKLNAGIITKLPDLYKTLSENIKTNFRLTDMTKYASTLLKLDVNNINMYELPGEYSGSEYTASYWLADMDELAVLVTETFGYDASAITTGKPGSKWSDDDTSSGDKKSTSYPSASTKTSSSQKSTSKTNDSDDDDEPKKNSSTTKEPSKTSGTSTPTVTPEQNTEDVPTKQPDSTPDAPEETIPDVEPEPEPEETEPPKPSGRPVIPVN